MARQGPDFQLMVFSSSSILSPPTLLDSPRWRNMRIGLLGGSFNPPHKGHIHISLIALHTLRLDCIWWMVTPRNPFKSIREMLPFKQRFEMCKDIARHPGILVSDIEQRLDYIRSINTVRELKKRYPSTEFVWITGMDVAHQLHRWYKWRDLLDEIAMVHICRPPAYSVIRNNPVRLLGGRKHIYPSKASSYPLEPGRSYWILQKKMIDISSTNIRRGAYSSGKCFRHTILPV